MTTIRNAACLAPLALFASMLLAGCGTVIPKAVPTSIGVRVLELADSTAAFPEASGFALLADTVGATRVARLYGSAPGEVQSTLADTYAYLRERVNELGANAYQVRERCAPNGPCRFIIDAYRVTDPEGEDAVPPGTVVLFGPLVDGGDAALEVDGKRRMLPPMRHLIVKGAGEELTISKGGLLAGSTVTVERGATQPASYWSTTGLTVEPGVLPAAGLGVRFASGRITQVPDDMGRFLMAVLHETDGDPNAAGR